jgi:hypothetical protein
MPALFFQLATGLSGKSDLAWARNVVDLFVAHNPLTGVMEEGLLPTFIHAYYH